jgi:hypothetical protein
MNARWPGCPCALPLFIWAAVPCRPQSSNVGLYSVDAGSLLRASTSSRVLGKFLGVLMFYPTWGVPRAGPLPPTAATYPALVLDLLSVLSTAASQHRLVLCLPWVCELLAMARDDQASAPVCVPARWFVDLVFRVPGHRTLVPSADVKC